jgi:hypothetical protein
LKEFLRIRGFCRKLSAGIAALIVPGARIARLE